MRISTLFFNPNDIAKQLNKPTMPNAKYTIFQKILYQIKDLYL